MMHGIYVDVPDVDMLLELEPEELAAKMFNVLVTIEGGKYRRGFKFNPFNTGPEIQQYANHAQPGQFYPTNQITEVLLALSEGYQWMRNTGLIVPVSDPSGASNGWVTLSRRAQTMSAEEDFRQFVFGRSIDRSLLHSSIRDEVWRNFARGNYATAVFEAMRAVEVAIREAAEYEASDHGVPMIRRAFHKDTGPLTDLNQPEAEREALMHLISGAIGSYKNPHSHRSVPLDDTKEAFEMVMLASHLLGIVETRPIKSK